MPHTNLSPESSGSSHTPFDPPIFGPSGSYEGQTNTLSLTNPNALSETQVPVGWSQHAHCQQPVQHEAHGNGSVYQDHSVDTTIISPIVANNVNPTLRTSDGYRPADAFPISTVDPSLLGRQVGLHVEFHQTLERVQLSPASDPVDDADALVSNLKEILKGISRLDIAQCIQVCRPMGVEQQSAQDGVGFAAPQSTAITPPDPISSKEPKVAITGQPESAGAELSPSATSTGPFQEAYNIIRELKGRWGPNSPTSFSEEDAAQIHGLFDRFQANQKELKSLLRYSGNKVEFIRTAIEMFLHLMRPKRGFIAEYDPSNGQEPSQLLKDHLIIKLSGESRYMTSPCGRFEGRSRCIHCSENRNNGKILKKRWRSWQHVIICLSVFIQGRRNVWYCFEPGW
jgi:hypothetical protein